MRKYWSEKQHSSCWCKLRKFQSNTQKNLLLAQINCFFQVYLDGDTFLNGANFASCTARKPINLLLSNSHFTIPKDWPLEEHHINMIIADNDIYSFTPEALFVDIIDIVPTPLLVAGFEYNPPTKRNNIHHSNLVVDISTNDLINNAKPFYLPSTTSSIRKSYIESHQNVQEFYAKSTKDNVKFLTFVDLYRNRNFIKYNPSLDNFNRELQYNPIKYNNKDDFRNELNTNKIQIDYSWKEKLKKSYTLKRKTSND